MKLLPYCIRNEENVIFYWPAWHKIELVIPVKTLQPRHSPFSLIFDKIALSLHWRKCYTSPTPLTFFCFQGTKSLSYFSEIFQVFSKRKTDSLKFPSMIIDHWFSFLFSRASKLLFRLLFKHSVNNLLGHITTSFQDKSYSTGARYNGVR